MSRRTPGRISPLTERILARLPGPRVFWTAAWASVPWLNAGGNVVIGTGARSAIWEQSLTLVLLNYAAVSLAIVIAIWGTGRIARRLETLSATTREVLGADEALAFREMSSTAGPFAVAVAATTAFGVGAFVNAGWDAGILRGVTWLVVGVALGTFLWTYATLQLGLDRLGRVRLDPDAALVDPTLGLQPLGGVAFMGLWMLLAWLVPVVLTGLPDVVGVAIGVAVLSTALGAFYLSLLRLHRQMAAVKANELALARSLYSDAYEPVRETRTLEALGRQQGLLGAAEALEKRALAIHDWPIDEATLARVITITTSVIATMIARLLIRPLGL